MNKISNIFRWWICLFSIMLIIVPNPLQAQSEMNLVGSFEQTDPSYWTKGAEPSGSTLEWAQDEALLLSRSLKITKVATTEAAKWTSENMCDNWAPTRDANSLIRLQAWVKTEGINTNPATDDAKWMIKYSYYDQSDVFIGEVPIELDQSVGTSDWTAVQDSVTLPTVAYKVIIEVIGGKDATGTVWADAFKWPSDWNQTLELPTGWFNWFPFSSDSAVSKGYENTRITTEEAHTGLHSLKFDLPFGREEGDAFVGTRRVLFGDGINPGDIIRISVWIKASNLVPDSAALYPETWAVGLTPLMFAGAGNNDGYDVLWGPDLQFKFPNVTSFDWTEYYEDVQIPVDGLSKAIEVRLHPYARFTGTIYFDDLKIEKLDIPEVAGVGSFEQTDPSYWTKGAEPSGSTLEWAQDEALLLSRSLKITKVATTEAAKWTSENMCDNWAPTRDANSLIRLQAWVKTEGINTNPATDDAKWMIKYSYYDQSDVFIGEVPIELDQSVGTSDWTAVQDSVTLPTVAYKVIIEVIGGKDATGTVWADAFKWPSDWNQTLELPTGWFNWFPFSSDSAVSKGYENTRITTEEAHTGLHSLKFDLPFGREEGDAFVGTRRVLFGDGINPGDIIRISVWIKASNLVPDSAALYPETWAVGLTPLMFAGAGNNDGYDVLWGPDLQFKFPNVTSFDWTEYYEDVQIPVDGLSKAIEVRLHPYARFTGTIYFDDLKIEKLDIPEVAGVGSFEQTDPSYWTKGAEPSGSTLEWAQDEALLLSRSLKITKVATTEAAKWTSENMCDNWAPTRDANSLIRLQAWVKTEGINTNPATDDAKWMIKYSYYDQSDVFIGEVPIELDQSVGTSDWTAVQDSVTLPTVAYKVIIEVIGGKDATGTVWADAFKWPSDWNQTLELPTGWFNWFPFSSDSAVSKGYENTRITTEEAHTGLHSLKFDLPFGREEGDAFVGTRRVLFGDGINPGDIIRISVWIKASNLVPDSAALYPETWAVGLTPLMFAGAGNNDGYDVLWGPDLQFKFPNVTSFDWTEYYEDVQIPVDGLSKAIEVRLHPYARFTGTIYFDDLKIEVIQKVTDVEGENGLPVSYDMSQNYPNPFNPTTTIRYSLPTNSFVTLRIYDILGREVKTLISTEQNSGTYNVQWNGDNNYGNKVSSGIYLYRIEAANFIMTKKMILLK